MQKLAEARQQKDLTVANLAVASGVHPTTIERIEAGNRTPTWETVDKVLKVLDGHPSEIAEFSSVPKPGDLCPCGCGGRRGADLRVIVVCQFCGKSRPDEHCTNHPHHCRRCSKAIRNAKYPEALVIIRLALARLGITLKEACGKAHIDATVPSQWVRGTVKPRRQSLQALADALEAQELMNAIEFRTDNYLLTCTGCGKIVNQRASVIRRCQDNAELPIKDPRHHKCSYNVDPRAGTGTYLCSDCSAGPNMTRYWKNRFKEDGRAVVLAELAERRARADPERVRESIKVAQAVVRGQPLSEEHKRNIGDQNIRPRPEGVFDLCRVCKYLTYAKDKNRPIEVHMRCWNSWRSEHIYSFSQEDNYPAPLKGQIPSSEKLADMFELSIRHLVKREPIEGETRLAEEFRLTRQGARKWVRDLLAYLPPDDRGGKKLARWAEVLHRKRSESVWRRRP